ncbi:MAG TPA: 16S rRNA (guanine(527)-N(7))-methyltransferase RsmG [Actinomycetota bacterium]
MKHEVGRLQTNSLPEQKLRRYEELLRTRAVPLGFISGTDQSRIRERHIDDSLRARGCLRPVDQVVVDVGSGAGLPGIPLAISEPGRRFVLIESSKRRAAFLEYASEALELANVSVVADRAEAVDLVADVCLARALASAAAAWATTAPLLGPGGILLYFAGKSWTETPTDPVPGATVAICSEPRFAWEGPIVMMTASSRAGATH